MEKSRVLAVVKFCHCLVCRLVREEEVAPEWATVFAKRLLRDAARQEREREYQERKAAREERARRSHWSRLVDWVRWVAG